MDTKLIVKAPNGIEDQTINCQLNWTIKKLKNYLSEVYPNKPVSFFFIIRMIFQTEFLQFHIHLQKKNQCESNFEGHFTESALIPLQHKSSFTFYIHPSIDFKHFEALCDPSEPFRRNSLLISPHTCVFIIHKVHKKL
jgi:hypothetical protein